MQLYQDDAIPFVCSPHYMRRPYEYDVREVILVGHPSARRQFLERALAECGIQTVIRDRAEDACAVVGDPHMSKVLLLDCELPNTRRSELCRKLRDSVPDRRMYIIAVVPEPDPAATTHGVESEADDCFAMPISISQLDMRLKLARRILRLEEELMAAHNDLSRGAMHDSLTGLLTRAAVFTRFENDLARAQREKTGVGVLLIDIDNFKQINDTFGHLSGDKVLRALGDLLKSKIRPYDSAGRYGGDEFIIIMPGYAKKTDLEDRAELLREAVASLPIDCGSVYSLTISVGLAAYDPESPQSVEELFRLADIALYCAKRSGKNQVAWT